MWMKSKTLSNDSQRFNWTRVHGRCVMYILGKRGHVKNVTIFSKSRICSSRSLPETLQSPFLDLYDKVGVRHENIAKTHLVIDASISGIGSI